MANLLELKDRVGRYLREAYSDVRLANGVDGYSVPFDNFSITVYVSEMTDPKFLQFAEENDLPLTRVFVRSWVSKDIQPSADFYQFMAEELTGKLSLQVGVADDKEAGTKVAYVYCVIPGDTIDPNELKWAVHSVLWESNTMGAALKEKFGAKWMFEG